MKPIVRIDRAGRFFRKWRGGLSWDVYTGPYASLNDALSPRNLIAAISDAKSG